MRLSVAFLDAAVSVPVYVLVLLGLVIVGLLVILWSVRRRKHEHLESHPEAPLLDLLPSIAGLTHSTLIEGNTAELVENGTFFDWVLDDIRAAKHSIHFETFLWKEGDIGQRMAEAFAERSRAGVVVRVLLDANGSRSMGENAERLLTESGCALTKYHPPKLSKIGHVNNRDHRKLLVIDGRIAYVGGHCVTDDWLGDAQDQQHFRDISARLRGPIVHAIQSTFSENWVETTGELFVGQHVFPDLEPVGDVAAHVARVSPEGAPSSVQILHHLVIFCAKERVWIQNPYFLPDPDGIKVLTAAAQRGVDVRVMAPTPEASDSPMVQHAGHFKFQELLDAGVRIFEYERTLLHQKVMTVDGIWSAIGSSNFDDRSFELNDEITVGLRSADLAQQFEAIFERDLEHCVERTSETWRQRPLHRRLRDAALYVINEQL